METPQLDPAATGSPRDGPQASTASAARPIAAERRCSVEATDVVPEVGGSINLRDGRNERRMSRGNGSRDGSVTAVSWHDQCSSCVQRGSASPTMALKGQRAEVATVQGVARPSGSSGTHRRQRAPDNRAKQATGGRDDRWSSASPIGRPSTRIVPGPIDKPWRWQARRCASASERREADNRDWTGSWPTPRADARRPVRRREVCALNARHRDRSERLRWRSRPSAARDEAMPSPQRRRRRSRTPQPSPRASRPRSPPQQPGAMLSLRVSARRFADGQTVVHVSPMIRCGVGRIAT